MAASSSTAQAAGIGRGCSLRSCSGSSAVSIGDVEADYVRSQARLRMADGTPPGVIDR